MYSGDDLVNRISIKNCLDRKNLVLAGSL
jgi:hypothetical protein